MVTDQLRRRGISDERVLAAMGAVPRERFLDSELADAAYDDRALPIGFGQTLSQPWIVAAICQALALRGDERVLEGGGGSGYSAAVLARLAGCVVSVELIAELADLARERLGGLGVGNVEIRTGDGAAGPVDVEGPSFDAIAVHAAAPSLPPALIEQLSDGGRLVIPIAAPRRGGVLRLYERLGVNDRDGSPVLRSSEISPARFVPLRGEAGFDGA